jgi:hypothetical protein
LTGSNQLINRLSSQVGSRSLAINLLIKRGHLLADGKTLTKLGQQRNEMTASERAIDRAVKSSKHNQSDYIYNPLTNKAVLKNGRQK